MTITFEPLGGGALVAVGGAVFPALKQLRPPHSGAEMPGVRAGTPDGRAATFAPPLRAIGYGAAVGFAWGSMPALRAAGGASVVVYGTGHALGPPLRAAGGGAMTGEGFAALPQLTVLGYGASGFAVGTNEGFSTVPGARVVAAGRIVITGEGAGSMPALRSTAFGSDALVGYGGVTAPALASTGAAQPPAPQASLVLIPWAGVIAAESTSPPFVMVSLHETIAARDGADTSFIVSLRERLGIAGRPVSVLSAAIELDDALAVRDTLQYALSVVLAEGLHLADDVDVTRRVLAQVTERLVLDGMAATVLDAQVTLAAALALGGEVAGPFLAALTETLDLGELLDVRIARVVSLLEELQIEAATSAGLTVVANVNETLLLSDDGAAQLSANVLLREAIECFGTLSINGDVWSCWLINTESKGVARYTNFPFNSFAKPPWGGYVGATDTGLHMLGGDTDDGAPIHALIRSALTDFGSRHLKRVPNMYLGYTASGPMVLKVVHTSEQGSKVEDWYQVEPRPAGSVRESRFKVGRGIASVYLGFELVNVAGADFALDVVEWLPMRLDRRVR